MSVVQHKPIVLDATVRSRLSIISGLAEDGLNEGLRQFIGETAELIALLHPAGSAEQFEAFTQLINITNRGTTE